jgi:signal transduction histidine kinase
MSRTKLVHESEQVKAMSRTKLVHESERTRVTRVHSPGRTLIHKKPLGPQAQWRLRHEVAMLERLDRVAGVAQLAEAPREADAIVLEDAGGTSLAALAKPLAVDDLIRIAVELARAVARVHRQGVMHRDITPANVVIARDGAPCLVDFALATSFAEIRPEFTHHTQILGTLAYLAPEQTGRTGRPVDPRADLYALGATLYELATGKPPFGSGDPLRITHDHLARVPVPPAELNRAVPAPLSEIVMHLLEKEPDNRYQTADGLLYDLERLRNGDEVRVGEHDVPLRLLPPSRLVGRDDEVAALEAAFEEALTGRCRGVLVSGALGVGKTALVDQLRPVVTGGDGWFVAGKFDQYRRDLEFDAVNQAFRALGRLLLAEPEDELDEVRGRILEGVGANAGLLTATVPEFAALLGVPPDAGDPLTAQVRAQRVGIEVLRAVASGNRPLVFFVDDLQWAGRTPVGFVDLVLSEEPVDGLLLVGAYREDVDTAHPLAAPLSRWLVQAGVQHLPLVNLSLPSVGTMVAEMLHVDPASATGLAEVIAPQTSGNPYETVELLNALARDGVLTATAAGWRWDAGAVHAQLGQSEVKGRPGARLDAASRRMVEAMACLGGRAELSRLQIATAEPAGVVEQTLAPALDEGLLVVEPGARPAVRFRHDRTREVILRELEPERRRALQLAMARRLAAVPDLFAVAAEQYLPAVGAIDDAAERCLVAGLLRRAASQATLIGDYSLVNALLAAALRLTDPGDTAALIEVHTGQHAALYSLGRLEDADDAYRSIEGLSDTALARADATVVQVRSLTHRNRFAEAIGLGIGSLRELGIAVPESDRLPADLDRQFEHLYRWLDHTDAADDPGRPEITDPSLVAASRLIGATIPAAYFADLATVPWLSLEAVRIWLEHGPGPTLLWPAANAAFHAVAQRGDDSGGYRAVRRILALGAARAYEPGTSEARHLFATLCWAFEPIENGVVAGQQARQGLIAGGDLATASYTYHPTVSGLLDSAPTLDVCVAELEAGLAFARRTGSEQIGDLLDSYRWLIGVLRGESSAGTGEAVPTDTSVGNPVALLHAHLARAQAAAIFGDPVGLAQHSAAAMPLLPAAPGLYAVAVAHLLRGLALAGQASAADRDEGDDLLSELDDVTRWLAERAANAPANFLHLLRLLEAERAWAVGDFRSAVLAFDAARREVADGKRPWHRALIAERTGRFFLGHGVDHAGYDRLGEARREYLAWGATAKVDQLDWAYPTLRTHADTPSGDQRATVTTGTIDLLGILSGSQALSSETSIERLHARVVEVLSAMTGATGVHLLLWSNEREDWLVPTLGIDGGVIPAVGTAVPVAVLRYVQRTREPLVIGDATRDERFSRDPYFDDVAACSLLAVPIVSRGTLRAVLLLENRLIRDAFTAGRLDAVKLLAGQLAVSLDNAQLYADFRRVADEQAALRRVATLVARGVGPDLVFAAVAEEIGALFGADGTAIVRFEPDGEATVMGGYGFDHSRAGSRGKPDPHSAMASVQTTGRAARRDVDDPTWASLTDAAAPGVRSAVASPIVVEGRIWGAMGLGSRHERLPQDAEQRLAEFTELVATAIANAESRAELTASRARIVAAADEARRRIERDLHDSAQQRLVHTVISLKLARPSLGDADPAAAKLIGEALENAERAIDEVRELGRGIHPRILSHGGLGRALDSLAQRSPIPVTLDVRTDERLPERIEVTAYYVVSEALTNAAKHSNASTVQVAIDAADGDVRLSISDDGVGGADPTRGSGLVGLKDRVEATGGRLTVESRPGHGTQLTAELPAATTVPASV